MADKTPKESSAAPFATRIDPMKADLSYEHAHFIKQVEMQQWKKRVGTLRTRNVLTGLTIGAMVVGICILNKVNPDATVAQVALMYNICIFFFRL